MKVFQLCTRIELKRVDRKQKINFFKFNDFANYFFSLNFQLTVMKTESWLHISSISVPQPRWLIFYLIFTYSMTFSMVVRHKVFVESLLFKAFLSVKENDKSNIYREG